MSQNFTQKMDVLCSTSDPAVLAEAHKSLIEQQNCQFIKFTNFLRISVSGVDKFLQQDNSPDNKKSTADADGKTGYLTLSELDDACAVPTEKFSLFSLSS